MEHKLIKKVKELQKLNKSNTEIVEFIESFKRNYSEAELKAVRDLIK